MQYDRTERNSSDGKCDASGEENMKCAPVVSLTSDRIDRKYTESSSSSSRVE